MKRRTTPPDRKEPGLLGKAFGKLVGFACWMVTALFVSIVIKWAGIAWFWPEQGVGHSQICSSNESCYLDNRVKENLARYAWPATVIDVTNKLAKGVAASDTVIVLNRMVENRARDTLGRLRTALRQWVRKYDDYVYAAVNITQLFFLRLAIIALSVSVFALFGLVGIADGLTERELRRWGAGRESATVYNLARRMVYPAFIIACVVYISFPTTVHPALVMVPCAMLFGYSPKVAFEKLKKYF